MIDTDENLYKKVISWLKRNKINYTIEEGSIDTTVKLMRGATGLVELIFNPLMTVPKALPRCVRPSHAAEGSMFYVKVGDWGKWINDFIAWAKERGYHECNNYHCAQWGTWKFNNFISYSFLNVFLKKILTMSGQMNESMELEEAKEILKENGYLIEEDYNFYGNPFYQMNQKRIKERNQLKKELIDEIIANSNWTEDDRETLMDFDVRKLKMLLDKLGV